MARLYYHKTDGGAEYLCSEAVPGTEEGSLTSPYIVRIDGDIRKDAELFTRTDETFEPSDADRVNWPTSDWQYDVANGDTKLGYNNWVLYQKEAEEHNPAAK